MPDKQPSLISVAMGVRYNRENTYLLERAVRSILCQSYSLLEFLICDDGSTSTAQSLLEKISREDCRVKLLRGCTRLDLAGKLNFCLESAQGAYIARMDDDDYAEPDRLAKQMAFLERNPNIAFVGCSVALERDGLPAGIRRLPEAPEARDFRFTQPFIHPSLLFRWEVLKAAGGYCESTDCEGCEDYDLLLRLYGLGYVGRNMPELLFRYTLPGKDCRRRPMRLRWNEVKTRYLRFRDLGFLPQYLPYVVKPVIVGLMPQKLLEYIKRERWKRVRD